MHEKYHAQNQDIFSSIGLPIFQASALFSVKMMVSSIFLFVVLVLLYCEY